MTTNGTARRAIDMIGVPVNPAITNRFSPIGGVMKPSPSDVIMNTQKWIGSMPMVCDTGNSSGARLTMRGAGAALAAAAALLALIAPLTLSGYADYQEWTGEWLEEVHEFFGNAMLLLVLAHVGLIAALSVLRRRNLAAPMIAGRGDGPGPDLVRRPHRLLAAALLAAVLGLWAWQWSSAPAPATGHPAGAQSRHHDDD